MSCDPRAASRTSAEAPTFADLMPSRTPAAPIPAEFTPEERIILMANGNLQRLVSAYHNAEVAVRVLRNHRLAHGQYERDVELLLGGVRFATAHSTVHLDEPELVDAVEAHGVALGQLFRHFEILPAFELQAVGRRADGAFEREYELSGRGVRCAIREHFEPGLFRARAEAAPSPSSAAAEGAPASRVAPRPASRLSAPAGAAHFGDIMAAAHTRIELPPSDFSPLQRLLLTANGNVGRIVSAYYGHQVSVSVNYSRPAALGGYEREVTMSIFSRPFLVARSSVHVLDPEWCRAVDAGTMPLGSIFQQHGVLPACTLHAVGRGVGGYFWRVYSLRASKVACEIHETFADDVFDIRPQAPAADERAAARAANATGGGVGHFY